MKLRSSFQKKHVICTLITFAGSIGALSLLSAPLASAAVKTWSVTATSGSWNTGANWGGTTPASGDSLLFGTQTTGATALTVDAATWGNSTISQTGAFLSGITFTTGASAYTMDLSSNPLSFSNITGITLNAGVVNNETFGTAAGSGTIYIGTNSGSTVNFINNGTGTLIVNTNLANGGTPNDSLTFQGTGNITFNGVISGMGNTNTKSGTGTTTLSAANTYTGVTAVNAGILNVTGNSSGSTSAFTVGGGTYTVSGTGSTGATTVNSGTYSVLGNGGTGATTINSSGTYSLKGVSGLNNSAITANTGGVLTVDNTAGSGGIKVNRLNSKAVTLAGGTFNYLSGTGASTDTSGTLAINSGGSTVNLSPNSTGSTTVTASSITHAVGGTLRLTGANLGAAPGANNTNLIANADATVIGGTGIAGSTTMSINAYILGQDTALVGNAQFGFVTDKINGVLQPNGFRLLTGGEYASTITDASTVLDNVNLTSAVTGLNSTTTKINALRLDTGGSVAGSGTLTINGGGIIALDSANSISISTLAFGSAEGNVLNANSLTISSNISGTAGFTKSGAGLLTLSGASIAYTGTTTIQQGTLKLVGTATLGTTAASLSVNGGGILDLNGTSQTVTSFNGGIGGAVQNNSGSGTSLLTIGTGAGTGTYAGVVANNNGVATGGSVALTKIGTGTITLSGTNTYTGATVTNGGTLSFTGSGGIATSSSLAVNGGSTMTIVNANVGFSGTININNGILNASAGNGTVGILGATAGANTGSTVVVGVAATANNATYRIVSNTTALNNPISVLGTGINLLDVGTNTGIFGANVALGTGANVIYQFEAGSNGSGVSGTTSGTGNVTINDFTNNTNNSSTTIGVLSNVGTLTINKNVGVNGTNGQILTLTGFGAGLTAITYNDDGNSLQTKATLIGGANTTFAGTYTQNGGFVKVNNSAAFKANNSLSVNSVTVSGVSVISQINSVNTTTNAVTAGTYAGNFDLNANNLTAAGLNSANTGGIVTNSGAARTLTLGGSGTYSYSGTLTATTLANLALTISLTGTGSQTLSGTNSYTGNTTITSGTLLLNSSTAALSNVAVTGGTLSGSGTANGTVNIGASGTINPGTVGGIGILTTGATTITGTYTCDINAASSDKIVVGGPLILAGATLAFNSLATPTALSYTLVTYSGSAPAFTTYTDLPSGYVVDYATSGQIKLVKTAGYSTWALSAGLTGPNNGALQDPDNDAISNLLEYVFNGNPLSSSQSILPTQDSSGNQLVFTYFRRHESKDDTTQTFQYGNNLVGWTDIVIPAATTVNVVITPDTPATAIDKVAITVLKGANTKLFGRLQVVK